ncbi:MAG: hypothetical protein VB824_02075 [Dehalococcoidia bacterium]
MSIPTPTWRMKLGTYRVHNSDDLLKTPWLFPGGSGGLELGADVGSVDVELLLGMVNR